MLGVLIAEASAFYVLDRGYLDFERLRKTASNPVVYVELPGAQHSFDLFHSIRFEALIDGIQAFATWALSQPSRSVDHQNHHGALVQPFAGKRRNDHLG